MKKTSVALCFLLFFSFFPAKGASSECKDVLGEALSYDISFLIFRNAAAAELTIHRVEKNKGKWFVATLTAKTKGFVGFLAQYTSHTYRSSMRFDESKKRLTSVKFAKDTTWGWGAGKSERNTRFLFDEERRVVTRTSKIDGLVERHEEMKIPEKIEPEDFLSALYNLRRGAHGVLGPGRNILLHTFPFPKKYGKDENEKIDRFVIRISTEKEKEKHREADQAAADLNTLVFIDVPAGLFDEKKPVSARIWADDCLIPTLIVVKDVMMFGDVVGRRKK